MVDIILDKSKSSLIDDVDADAVRLNRMDALYRFHNISIFAVFIGPVPLLWYLNRATEDYLGAVIWILLIYLVNSIFILVKIARERSGNPGARKWLTLVAIRAVIVGSMLGSIPIFVNTNEAVVQMVLMTFLSFYIVGGVTVYSPFWGFLMLYNVPLVSFSATHAILEGSGPLAFIGYTYFLWIPITYVMVRAFNKFILNGIYLAHSNDMLVEKLNSEKRDAEQANLGKSRFIAAASHDLRQPLHALGLFVNQLNKINNEEERRILNEEIVSSVSALRTMLDGLLDVSRIDAQSITPKIEAFFLYKLFESIESEFNNTAHGKPIKLTVVHTKICVESDFSLLERIVRNLIANAFRYTDSGKILLGVRHRGTRVEIQVCDTGIGIEESKQESIFEEFVQISNPERDRKKGVGLGLSIVKRLSMLLGHEIRVKSTLGKGTCFSILVPKAQENSFCDETVTFFTEEKLDGMIVLVVDDDVSILAAMRLTIENWGGVVFTAESGSEATEVLDREGILPDVMIVDYRLREHEKGSDAIRQLHDYLGENVDTILLTGDLKVDISSELVDRGIVQLHKPIDPLKLNNFLHQIKIRTINT